jgi:hypothetical protein
MSEPKPARPAQVTLAGWLVVAGSVLVVLLAFSQVATLRSLETREAVEEYLSTPPGDSLGLGVQGLLNLLKIASMVAAASAAASAILGWQALQRSRGARVALSFLAGPLFISGIFSGGVTGGGVVPAMVTAAIVMLWFQPARDWFDGIVRTPPPAAPAPLPPAPREPVGRDPLLDLPPPTAPPLHPTPYAERPAARGPAVASAPRPPAVTGACLLTWVFSVPALVLFASTLVALVANPQSMVDELHSQNAEAADQFSDATLRAVLYATSAGILMWSLAAILVAVLVWRRVAWASPVLMVSAGGAAALCLLGVVGSLLFAVPLAACAATLALLLRPEARAWFRRSA